MQQEISDGFWIGAECVAGVFLIVMLLALSTTSHKMYSSFEEQQATTQRLTEARQWNAYDGKQVYSSDIISLYNRYSAGELPETIDLNIDGHHYNLKTLTATQVDSLVTAGFYYDCTIHRNEITNLVDNVYVTRTSTPR